MQHIFLKLNFISSRLPIPFRISALEEPKEEHKRLLTLILQPISDKIKCILEDKESELSKTLSLITNYAKKPVDEEKDNIGVFDIQSYVITTKLCLSEAPMHILHTPDSHLGKTLDQINRIDEQRQ